MSQFFVISAPSGAGKTTLTARLLSNPLYARAVPHTTRPPRPDERDGIDYHFVDVRAFRGMIGRGEFVEYAEVHGNLYGTSLAAVEKVAGAGLVVLLIVDWRGAQRVRQVYPDCTSIFVLPPSMPVLEARLRGRGQDSDDVIVRRLKNAAEEMSHIGEFTYFVVNDDLDDAHQRLVEIIQAR